MKLSRLIASGSVIAIAIAISSAMSAKALALPDPDLDEKLAEGRCADQRRRRRRLFLGDRGDEAAFRRLIARCRYGCGRRPTAASRGARRCADRRPVARRPERSVQTRVRDQRQQFARHRVWRKSSRRSEPELRRELHDAWIESGGDRPEAGRAQGRHRRAEIHRVQQVEDFHP